MRIEIKKWDDYNPKRAQKTYTWVRLNNDIFSHESLFGMKLEQKSIYIALLCHASTQNCGKFELDLDWFAHHIGCTAALVQSSLNALQKRGLISQCSESKPDDEDHYPHATPTNETNGTDKRDETNEPPDQIGKPTPQKLMDFWNRNRKHLPECTKLSDSRIKKARAQLAKDPEGQRWADALKAMTEIDFGWRPCFDDWLSESKRIKAREGAYSVGKSKSYAEKGIDHRESQRKRILGGNENELKTVN